MEWIPAKICLLCKVKKPLNDYYFWIDKRPSRDSKKYYQSYCKTCINKRPHSNEYGYKWRENNPEKWKDIRLTHRLKVLGITRQQYDSLLKKCFICSSKEGLCLDHNHITGEFRGLICHSCNKGLGHFRDNPILLEKAIKYLKGVPYGIRPS